jgi:monoamine oxidase
LTQISANLSNRFSDIEIELSEAGGVFSDLGGGYVEPLDDNLKQLIKELGTAINDSLSNSEKISEAIARIRSSGFDVFLVLEATIGFNKRQEEGSDDSVYSRNFDGEGQLNITSQDVKFLKSLKISIDEKID